MKKQTFIGIILAGILLGVTGQAALVHSYDFQGVTETERLQDKTGSADLSRAGSGTAVVISGDGRAIFSNDAEYLIANVTDDDTFVISFWFMIESAQPDYDAMVSSYDSKANGDGVASFQIDFLSNNVRITSGDSDAYGMGDKTIMSNPSLNTWHHIAVMGAPSSWSYSTQVWVDGGTVNKIASARAGDLVKLLLGMNRNLNNGFGGSIANVKIYDSTGDWSDAVEATEWAAGPGVSMLTPYNPNPADGSTLTEGTTEFTWQAGDPSIASYNVYFGSTGSPVYVGNYATTSVPIADLETATGIPVLFNASGEYQWYVQSLDASSAVLAAGPTWSVTVEELGAYIIDDFWVYDDTTDLLAVWSAADGATLSIPGITLPTDQGSSTGFIRPVGIMQLNYDNTSAPNTSEAALAFSPAMDWLGTYRNTLSVSYHGLETNDTTDLYAKISDGTTTATFNSPLPDDATTDPWWKTWNIRFSDMQAVGLNLSNITQLSIGVGDGSSSTTGTMFIDDIELNIYNKLPEYQPEGDVDDSYVVDINDLLLLAADWLFEDYTVSASASAPVSGLRASYAFDETSGTSVVDSSGNGFNATVNVSTNWDAGGVGSTGCLVIDDTTEVTIPAAVMTGVSDQLTVSMWVYGLASDFPHLVDYAGIESGDSASAKSSWDAGGWQITDSGQYDDWNHYAIVKDATAGTVKTYHNGILMAQQSGLVELIVGADTSASVLLRDSDGSQAKIDNLQIYNTALTQNEIVYLIGGGSHQITQPINPLFTNVDLSGNGRIDLGDLAVISKSWLSAY